MRAPPAYIKFPMGKKQETTTKSLPQIREISWVKASDVSDKRIDVGDETESGVVRRAQILYKYEGGGKRQMILVPSRDDTAFFRTNGVEEDSYVVPKTGVKTMLGRNVVKLFMDDDNDYHKEFYDVLTRIRTVVKKKLDKDKGSKTNVQIKGLYDLVDEEKNITGHVLVARLIESRTGEIHTSAYNDEEQIDIMDIGRCVVRPALILQYTVPDDDSREYRITVSVTQMYAKTQGAFPLRDRD
ncbi:hypothetical protein K457DRAFT_419177 [Linnemannia elongata AG-77]|uniref:Uncharacterized protein n=1 Tax=Linnemannia elongata AG-77 TaxID=1314771 RepID=A0A197JAM7_9FUNG|nr:hypothetical protein K457DRAFT_419177 [Linnemannia elongata AG-77]